MKEYEILETKLLLKFLQAQDLPRSLYTDLILMHYTSESTCGAFGGRGLWCGGGSGGA